MADKTRMHPAFTRSDGGAVPSEPTTSPRGDLARRVECLTKWSGHKTWGSGLDSHRVNFFAPIAQPQSTGFVLRRLRGQIRWELHSGVVQLVEPESLKLRASGSSPLTRSIFRRRSTAGREILVLTIVVRVHSPDPFCGYGEIGKLPRLISRESKPSNP